MSTFDLEQFKAGRPAITRDGEEAYFVAINTRAVPHNQLIAHIDGHRAAVELSLDGKFSPNGEDSNYDLVAMAPQHLSGWINVYEGNVLSGIHLSRKGADSAASIYAPAKSRIACIDLSQFEEGHGL